MLRIGRCFLRIRYRLSRLNAVECMVIICCIACVLLLVYAVGLHNDNNNLLVLQDANNEKEPVHPNKKTRGRRSIADFSDQSNDKAESLKSNEQYEFMELKDFDTEDEKSSDINIMKGFNQMPNQAERQVEFIRVDDGQNSENGNQNMKDNVEKQVEVKFENESPEERDKKPTDSKVFPLPNNSEGRIDIYEKTGTDHVNNPIVQTKNNTSLLYMENKKKSVKKIISDIDKVKKMINQERIQVFNYKVGKVPSDIHDVDQKKLYIQPTGGLGTKLFQYASLVGIAKQTNRRPVITPDSDIMYSFQHLSVEVNYIPSSADIAQIHETHIGEFSAQLLSLPLKDTLLCCYLQSWRYFQIYEDSIRKDFTFTESITNKAVAALNRANYHHKLNAQRLKKLNSSIRDFSSYTYIGVHVRRGDHHVRGFNTAPLSYINMAMEYFRTKFDNALFIFCSDDIKWCKDNINGTDIEYVSTGEAVVDLALLTRCNHTIVTVGAFGWWAGWLTGGEVVYYKNWPQHGSELDLNIRAKDYFPNTWLPMGH